MITTASIFFAVLLAILIASLQDGVYGSLVKNAVNFYTGYIQVHKKNYWDERILDNTILMSDTALAVLNRNKQIQYASPRLESFVLASFNEKTTGCFLSGIDTEKESRMISLKDKLISGSYLEKNENALLIAEGLAKKLKVALQDTLVIIGQGYHGATAAGKYPIKGILKFASLDLNNSVLFLPLSPAQELFSAEGIVTSLVLMPQNPQSHEMLKQQLTSSLGAEYEVHTWKDLLPGLDEHIKMCTADGYIFIAVLYILVAFGIFGTLLMMIAERNKEFSMMITIGMRKRQLGIMVLLESIFIAIIGSTVGAVVGIPVTHYFKHNPIQLGGSLGEAYALLGFEPSLVSSTNPDILLNQTIIILCIATFLSFYPLFRIIRMKPEDALKR